MARTLKPVGSRRCLSVTADSPQLLFEKVNLLKQLIPSTLPSVSKGLARLRNMLGDIRKTTTSTSELRKLL